MTNSTTQYRRPTLRHYFDRTLLASLWSVALPVTIQTVLFSSKGVIDVIMVGQLSELDVAAAGIATKILFVLTILLSGITTGGAMLAAQYFGANDRQGIKRSIALSWLIATSIIVFAIGTLFFSNELIIRLTTVDQHVISLTQTYLLYAAPSLVFMAYQASIAAGLRSMKQASVVTHFNAIGITLNIFFNWLLIFGYWGFPTLGLQGAAIGTLLSAFIEAGLLYFYLTQRRHLLAFRLDWLFSVVKLKHLRQFVSLSLPTTINFLLWAIGVFSYTAIMGQTGTQGLAVLSIISPIEAFSLSLLTGIANASAVTIGNNLGAKDFERAYYQSIWFTVFAVIATLCVSLLLYLNIDTILSWFSSLTPDTLELAYSFYFILCIGILFRSVPTVMVVGVLRAGGDVKFCLYQDLLTQWLFGLPIAAICAIWLKLPADIVFITFFFEALFKWFACIYRFKTRKWMNHIAE